MVYFVYLTFSPARDSSNTLKVAEKSDRHEACLPRRAARPGSELPGHFRGHFSNPREFEKGNHLAGIVYCLDGSRVVRLLPI